MTKFVPIEKQSKKAQKAYNKSQRVGFGFDFNTGSRYHKTDKMPSRAKQKELDRKEW